MINKENLYKSKYRLESSRLKNWDYSCEDKYFITICTENRDMFFGNVKNGDLILNNIGKIADKFWLEIPEQFYNVILDEFLIMQNHVHGILIINNNINIDTFQQVNDVDTLQCNVFTEIGDNKNQFYSKISPKQKSISTIIRSYKSICSKTINKMQNDIFLNGNQDFMIVLLVMKEN